MSVTTRSWRCSTARGRASSRGSSGTGCPGRFEFACHGECPKNRFLTDRYGEPGLNYLCEGYHSFLQHVAPYMDFMAGELASERPPANIMHHLEEIEHQNINRKTTNQQ